MNQDSQDFRMCRMELLRAGNPHTSTNIILLWSLMFISAFPYTNTLIPVISFMK